MPDTGRSRTLLWIVIGGGAFFLFVLAVFTLAYLTLRTNEETTAFRGSTNKIYADKGSIVGSIGVIAEWVNYGDLLHWAKLKDITMKAGEFKDTGSPTRDMTPAEKEYLQSLIDNMHGQFIQAVADGRKSK